MLEEAAAKNEAKTKVVIKHIKQAMKEKGLTPEQVTAKMWHWGPIKFDKFITGKTKWGWAESFADDFAKPLGVSAEWLLGKTDNPEPPPRELGATLEGLEEWLFNPVYAGTTCPCDFDEEQFISAPAWLDAARPVLERLNPRQAQRLVFIAHTWLHGKPAFTRLRKVVDFQEARRARMVGGVS